MQLAMVKVKMKTVFQLSRRLKASFCSQDKGRPGPVTSLYILLIEFTGLTGSSSGVLVAILKQTQHGHFILLPGRTRSAGSMTMDFQRSCFPGWVFGLLPSFWTWLPFNNEFPIWWGQFPLCSRCGHWKKIQSALANEVDGVFFSL